jgi:hypothetical protein
VCVSLQLILPPIAASIQRVLLGRRRVAAANHRQQKIDLREPYFLFVVLRSCSRVKHSILPLPRILSVVDEYRFSRSHFTGVKIELATGANLEELSRLHYHNRRCLMMWVVVADFVLLLSEKPLRGLADSSSAMHAGVSCVSHSHSDSYTTFS